MRWLRLPVTILAGVVLSAASAEEPKTKPAKEQRGSLDGTWSVVSAGYAGQVAPQDSVQRMRFVFSGTQLTIKVANRVVAKTEFTTDATKHPATVRLTFEGKETLGIYKIEGDRLTICLSGSTKERPSRFASEADSPNRMLFRLARGDLTPIGRSFLVVSATGMPVRKWTTLPKDMGVGSPDWSPDGKKIAFDGWRLALNENNRTAHIYVAAADGTGLQDLAFGAMPSWSPDGTMLAFCQYSPQHGVWVMNSDGSGRELIDADGWGVAWSPVGNEIAYTLYSRGANLCVVNPKTDARRFLLKKQLYASVYWNMSWAPDGRRLCFMGIRPDGAEEIAVVSSHGDTKGFKVLLSTKDSPEFTSIEPIVAWDGNLKQILACMRGPGDKCLQIYILDPDAKKPPRRLPGLDPKRNNLEMAWSPDGKMIVFTSEQAK